MNRIQDLFDVNKGLNREIESVVTFDASTEDDLKKEIREYVVTDRLRQNYEDVIQDFQRAFDDSSKEIGIWVSGFYGSGKSSFAKYLGLSFDKSKMIDGVTFGEKLMSRVQDSSIAAMHKTLVSRHNPQVIMIDLSTHSVAGKLANVSDIVYYETIKLLGITKSTDQKVMGFIDLLISEGKYESFCEILEKEEGKRWEDIESKDVPANIMAAKYAPRLLPAYFPDSDSFRNLKLNSAINEKERFVRLYDLVKEKTGKDKIIFVLDEVGQYVASNVELILNLQGMLQILKDQFRGKVWVIATAQQTLTEDNHAALLNSNELYRLNDRFPVKVDIEANDIKEIITKRLLGKSQEGSQYLKQLFKNNESILKNSVHLALQERSIYNQSPTDKTFADLYPFLPVHIDILLALLQKLASRTGGVGLRSVIRLTRDILVENHLADAIIGKLAGPEHFYDVLRSDMEKNSSTKEIVFAADKAMQVFNGNALAVRICKTIAIMQLLDDFNLTFDNLCALLYDEVGSALDKSKIREILDEITTADGLTLQEVEGKYQFMTNAILGIREERNKIIPKESEKAAILQDLLKDMLTPAPSVNIFSSKTINAAVDLSERNKEYTIISGSVSNNIKINIRFVDGSSYSEVHQYLQTESTHSENNKILYWICTLAKDKESILQDIVRCQIIKNRHQGETNKEIIAYLKSQSDTADDKKRKLSEILREAQGNSEVIFKGSSYQVNGENYKVVALKPIAEKIFEKYQLASANLKSDCVTRLAGYEDLTTVSDALNPFKIINKSNGTIDISNSAISEIKDFIARRNEATGQDIFNYFEREPYGWAKDTIRYIVALMLKASVIQLRTNGKDITVFGDNAVAAMQNNNSFSKINVSLNTEGVLTSRELLKACQALRSLFNSQHVGVSKDSIAKEANAQIKQYLADFNSILSDFKEHDWAGLGILQKAINYSQKIVASEGGEAAYFLAKEADCVESIKYALDVKKARDQKSLIDELKYISEVIEKSKHLPEITYLSDYSNRVNDVAQEYNKYVSNADFHVLVSEIKDLRKHFDGYIHAACIEFQTSSNEQLDNVRKEKRAMPEYEQLTDEHRSNVDTLLDELSIEYNESSLDNLQRMTNAFTTYYLPGGRIDKITEIIKKFAKEDLSKPTKQQEEQQEEQQEQQKQPTTSTQQTSSVSQKPNVPSLSSNTQNQGYSAVVKPKKMNMKRKLTTRVELENLINQLQKYLAEFDEKSPIELDFED